jgi:hypothetical protein
MRVCRAAFDRDAARRAQRAVKLMEGLMSIDWQNGAPDRGRGALPESYKPRALRLAAAAQPGPGPLPAAPAPAPAPLPSSSFPPASHPTAEELASQEPAAPVVDLRKLEAELGRKRLDEIADVVRLLTYGEMMELAEMMWNVRPGDAELTEHNLPAVLYRWSTSRQQS